MQLGNPPTAGDPVHDAGADKLRPRPAEATRPADDADCLGHVLPFAAASAEVIGQVQSVTLIPRGQVADPFLSHFSKLGQPEESIHI
jgi:hypothetical protein